MCPRKKKRSLKSNSQKGIKKTDNDFNLDRISEDITALRTALNMQAALISDIEQTLKIQAREPSIS